MKNPPVMISVLGFFAAVAGVGYLYFGLRVLGFDWFGALGDMKALEGVGLQGWAALIIGVVWLAVAGGLWSLQPWAWMFGMIVAAFGLLEALFVAIDSPFTGAGFWAAIVPLLIIWYLNSAEVKAEFGVGAGSGGMSS